MALIFRSILEVDADNLVSRGPELFSQWLSRKPGLSGAKLVVDGEPRELGNGHEVVALETSHKGIGAFRASLFEARAEEQVKTTFTAISDGSGSWSWVDLERWADKAWDGGWVPYSPGIVGCVLRAVPCHRGPTPLDNEDRVLEGADGARLARQILDPERVVPIVVATPTSRELKDGLGPARLRARELQRRLAGVAPVYLLSSGAVSSFSRAMLRVRDEMDVHSGAVRTYLPGVGQASDAVLRHRYVPYYRIQRGPTDQIARLVAPRLIGIATHQVPPPPWQTLRELPEFSPGGIRDADLEHLVEIAEGERDEYFERVADAEKLAEEAETLLELERESQSELLNELESLGRRLRYAETKLREHGSQPEPPGEEPFTPDFCEDVVSFASEQLGGLDFGPRVLEGARRLDEHAEAVWARKALRALRALDAYADAKSAGLTGGLKEFLEGSTNPGLPARWVAMRESEGTDNNAVFREIRTFVVENDVDSSGFVYMPAHVKLSSGGNPAPRIHFYDDTGGVTKKVHIGWLGPHLDSKAKS